MRIILVGVNGALNSGDQTLCEATIRLLQETFPDAKLSGVHRNPELQSIYFPSVEWLTQIGVSHSLNRLTRRFVNVGGLAGAAAHLAFRSRNGAMLSGAARRTYQAIANADLVVGCAGGWLEDHYVSIWTNLLHLSIAAENQVPIFIAPQSIGPFRHRCSRWLARRVLQKTAGVTARESISMEQAKELGVNESRLRLFPDLALFEQSADHEQAEALLRRLCGSDVPPLGGTTIMPWSFPGSSNPAADLNDYLSKVANTAKLVYQKTGLKTLFLRQIRDARGHKGDGELVQKVAAMAGDCGIFAPDYLEPALLRGVIARCQVFWGTRLHSNIFAATQRVPVVAIAYQHKAEGIMNMLGMGEFVVRIDDFQSDGLAQLIAEVVQQREKWRGVLDQKFAKIQPEWEQLKAFLVHSAGSGSSEKGCS